MSKPIKGGKFKYSLEVVLKVRDIREKEEQDKFREKEKILAEEIQKEKKIKEQEQQEYSDLLSLMTQGNLPDMNIIQLRKRHLETVKEQVNQQIQKRETAEKNRDDQREKLAQAVKEKKIIEKDKEKTREAWKKLMLKEEAKFMDDISGIGYESKRRKTAEEQAENLQKEKGG
jgi:flagellar protein FliJ